MSTDIKQVVKERYGEAARKVIALQGQSSCCGPAIAAPVTAPNLIALTPVGARSAAPVNTLQLVAVDHRAANVAAAGCCGGPAPAGIDACCVRDADAKAAGQDGCGCGATEATTTEPAAVAGGCCG